MLWQRRQQLRLRDFLGEGALLMYEQCSGCCWAMFRLNAYGVYVPYWCELHSLRIPDALADCFGAC